VNNKESDKTQITISNDNEEFGAENFARFVFIAAELTRSAKKE
jgi:hypothetical protein